MNDQEARSAASVEEHDFIADLGALRVGMSDHRPFAEAVYAALCNVDWTHEDGTRFSATWRMAAQIVADLRGLGEDYLDFYCGGNEGTISRPVAVGLAPFGWTGTPL